MCFRGRSWFIYGDIWGRACWQVLIGVTRRRSCTAAQGYKRCSSCRIFYPLSILQPYRSVRFSHISSPVNLLVAAPQKIGCRDGTLQFFLKFSFIQIMTSFLMHRFGRLIALPSVCFSSCHYCQKSMATAIDASKVTHRCVTSEVWSMIQYDANAAGLYSCWLIGKSDYRARPTPPKMLDFSCG